MAAEELIARSAELLWTGALAATPLALVVTAVSRWRRVRPATRHMLWVGVLASFITPAIGTVVWRPQWFRSDRLLAAADSVLRDPEPTAPELRPPPSLSRPAAGSAEELTSPPKPGRAPGVSHSQPVLGMVEVPAGVRDVVIAATPAPNPSHDPAPEFVGPLYLPVAGTTASAPIVTQKFHGLASHQSRAALSDAFVGPLPLAPSTALAAPAAEELAAPARVSAAASDPPALATPRAPQERSSGTASHPSAGGLRPWLLRVLSVRDSLADLPPIPLPLWLGGAVVVVMLSAWRRCIAMLWLRRATPAGPHVQALVRQVGDALGLSTMPRVVFVEAAVSPMIWCGLRPLLVLPTTLWRTLDEDSRRAVLVHELAHVRRWDHLLCWVTAAIGALYWWHPVVWWARRKLHEEAEASCDAWVTNLFPTERRAYASALVVATSFVSSRAEARGPWLGVASGSAKRLARRITMVMTHKAAPKVSMLGLCVTALVIATGTFVMPSLACPPEEEEARAKTPKLHAAPVARSKASGQNSKAPAAGATFFGEAPALEAMKGRPAAAPQAPTPPTPPTPMMSPRAPRPPVAPVPPQPAQAPKTPMAAFAPAPGQAVPLDLEALKEGRSPRSYQLAPGKLEAFYEMMSRGDVPILVQMDGDHIVIWGTDDEHAVFGKFVKIVDGQGRGSSVSGQRRALQVDAERGAEAGVEAARARTARSAERAALDQYRSSLLAATREREAVQRSAEKARADAEAARDRISEQRERESAQRRELEAAASTLRSRSDALQAESRTTEQRVRELERQIRQMEERAQRLEKQVDDRKPGKNKRSSAGPESADSEDVTSPNEMSPEPSLTTVEPSGR